MAILLGKAILKSMLRPLNANLYPTTLNQHTSVPCMGDRQTIWFLSQLLIRSGWLISRQDSASPELLFPVSSNKPSPCL